MSRAELRRRTRTGRCSRWKVCSRLLHQPAGWVWSRAAVWSWEKRAPARENRELGGVGQRPESAVPSKMSLPKVSCWRTKSAGFLAGRGFSRREDRSESQTSSPSGGWSDSTEPHRRAGVTPGRLSSQPPSLPPATRMEGQQKYSCDKQYLKTT